MKRHIGRHQYLSFMLSIRTKDQVVERNSRFKNPLPDAELEKIFNSAQNYTYSKEFAEYVISTSIAEK